jgi:hypothetical protein
LEDLLEDVRREVKVMRGEKEVGGKGCADLGEGEEEGSGRVDEGEEGWGENRRWWDR